MAQVRPPGTTIAGPVGLDHRPNLRSSIHEVQEYLQEQGAYDLFDHLLKELLTKRPADPLQHMLDCLRSDYPLGPLKVVVSSVPGVGRHALARRLAEHFGLEYISAGELLRETGADAEALLGGAEELAVGQLVMERVMQATEAMRGWVLDGFPRTRFQATFLNEHPVVPTHVLLLKTGLGQILERAAAAQEAGERVPSPQELERKLRLHTCHVPTALEPYNDKITVIDAAAEDSAVWAAMESAVRTLPASKGPNPPPRVVLLGPRGVGVREHASRLAIRLGAVFIDAANIEVAAGSQHRRHASPDREQRRRELFAARSKTSLDLPNVEPRIAEDKLGATGVRLRQPDCSRQGYVMCGFPVQTRRAELLHEDPRLAPTRVIVLDASADTCIRRLRLVLTDPATGKVWTVQPKDEKIRRRLQRRPEDQPAAVAAAHGEFVEAVPSVLEVLGTDGRCTSIPADAAPEVVFRAIAEFAERPLPLPRS